MRIPSIFYFNHVNLAYGIQDSNSDVAFILYKIKESISFEMRFINYLQFLKEMKSNCGRLSIDQPALGLRQLSIDLAANYIGTFVSYLSIDLKCGQLTID